MTETSDASRRQIQLQGTPFVERKKGAEEGPHWWVWFIIWTAAWRIVLVLDGRVVIPTAAEDRGGHKGVERHRVTVLLFHDDTRSDIEYDMMVD